MHVLLFLLMLRSGYKSLFPNRFDLSGVSNTYESVVSADGEKKRLDQYLSNVFQEHTRSYISVLCENGLVFVNNKIQNKSYKVSKGDVITFTVEEKTPTSVAPEKIPLDILYEDEYILCVNKPSGMVVHPAVGSPNGTFVNALLYHLGSDAEKLLHPEHNKEIALLESDDDEVEDGDIDLPETPAAAKASPVSLRPGIVHRLDKGTTGVLIAGKTPEAVAKLCKLFAQRQVKKVYVAVCVGHPGHTTIAEPIGRSHKNRQLMCVYDGPPGKPAVTHVRTLAFDGRLSAGLLRIETGRTHQIRVHLKERRTPVLGDEAYGSSDWNRRLLRSDSIRRPLLHAYQTQFTHPFTGRPLTLRAPIPPDMAALLAKIAPQTDKSDNSVIPGESALLDPLTGLLRGSCHVPGRDLHGEGGQQAEEEWDEIDEGEDILEVSKGFVPMDRLVEETEDWTLLPLSPDLDGY
mmetsp:Transcript_12817/g.19256  ORF Transcript_12817/g.19256 Transcript_12817/m.19256 type:complete len:461 (+) Transcript_12817:25-1407(+)